MKALFGTVSGKERKEERKEAIESSVGKHSCTLYHLILVDQSPPPHSKNKQTPNNNNKPSPRIIAKDPTCSIYNTFTHTHTHTHTHTERETDRQTDRQTETDRQTDIHTGNYI